MNSTRTIRPRNILENLRLTLALQCSVAAANESIAYIVKAVIVMPSIALIQREVSVTDLHDELIDVAGQVHQAVQQNLSFLLLERP